MFVSSDLSESQFPDEEEVEISGAEDDVGEQQLLLNHVSSLFNSTHTTGLQGVQKNCDLCTGLILGVKWHPKRCAVALKA